MIILKVKNERSIYIVGDFIHALNESFHFTEIHHKSPRDGDIRSLITHNYSVNKAYLEEWWKLTRHRDPIVRSLVVRNKPNSQYNNILINDRYPVVRETIAKHTTNKRYLDILKHDENSNVSITADFRNHLLKGIIMNSTVNRYIIDVTELYSVYRKHNLSTILKSYDEHHINELWGRLLYDLTCNTTCNPEEYIYDLNGLSQNPRYYDICSDAVNSSIMFEIMVGELGLLFLYNVYRSIKNLTDDMLCVLDAATTSYVVVSVTTTNDV